MDLTPLFQAFIALLSTIITFVVTPYINLKYKDKRLADTIEKSVKAAQQLAKTLVWNGGDKKAYVVSCLESKGYSININDVTDSLNAMIEAAVYELKN